MPNSVGPGINEEGLIFAYDTKDTSNSYVAPPHENLLTVFGHSYGGAYNNTGFIYESRDYEMIIPQVGRRPVKGAYYWNNYPTGTGNTCCPNLFYYHAGNQIEGIKGSTLYTYSIIYKHTGNYTHPNFMYRYERRADGSAIKEGGLHSTGRRTHLGDGWYHAWGQFTTDVETRALRCYSFLYNYQQHETFYVAGISLVEGDLIIPPQQMTLPGESISTTEALKDLTGTEEIILADVSFDQNANITFDGSNDYIRLSADIRNNFSSYPNSVELVLKKSSADQFNMVVFDVDITRWNLNYNEYVPGQWSFDFYDGTEHVIPGGNYDDQYVHFVLQQTNTGAMELYANGALQGSEAAGALTPNGNTVRIGSRSNGDSRYFKGELPILKIYDRALSSEEVQQKYNAIKGRFNI